jgi:long-chain acyl-CoA synthetase
MTPTPRAHALEALTAPGQPYALQDDVIDGRALRRFTNAPRSLRALYEATATDRPFLAYEDERLSFVQAWAQASRIGHVLVHACGVAPGDRVAISMRNYPEWILAFTAITSIGAIAVAMNAHWQADEMAYGLRDSGAKVLLADQERLDRLARCEPIPGLAVLAVRATRLPPGVRALSSLTDAAGEVAMPAADVAPEDAATILYTSGSTGHPKGVVSTHRNILSALMSWELDRAVSERVAGIVPAEPAVQDGTLLAVPLFHVTGLAASYLASYRLQRRVVCMYRWDAEAAAALVERERLASVVGPAAVTGDLLRVAREGRHDLACLLALGGGGAPRAPEQVRQIGASFANALPITGWGMTETFAIGAGIGGEDYLARPESSGRCSQVLQLQVVDERGVALPAGARGELRVRGASLFRGYWNRPDVDAEVFDDGWFRTGDLAWLDDEGFVYIVDRIKDLIIRGGENVGCGTVEAALLQHPAVHEAAVYAVPDERLGEEVGATVYCDDALDLDALRAFLATRLAAFEVPRHILKSAEPLPRTPSGKILKRRIREAALGIPPA